MSTLLQHIKLYERHRQWLLELRPDYNDDDEDLERGLQRLGRQVSNVVSSFLQTAGQQLESLATSHNGPHPNPDAWGSLGARDRMLTPRSHQLAVLHRVEATMSAAGDTSNPPLSVTGLASASADARLVFVFVPMTQIASSFEPAYSLVDLTSSESLEELIPVLEEAPPREQTETGTQTVKTLTHGTTQTCKELLPPEIVYAETGVGSHFAILPPEPEMGVGSEDALWEAPHIVTADASVGSQHVFPPTPPVMVGRGVGESKVDPDRKPPGTKRKTDSIHVTNVSTSSKSTVVETYEIEYQREEVPHIPPMVDEARGLRAAHISRSYTITPGGKRVNVMEVYSSDSETKMSSKSVSTNRCTSPSSRASTPPAKGKKSKSCKKANKSNSRSASINRDRLAINQSIRSRATDYRSTVRSKERATRESDDVSNSHSRSISLASGRANSISPYDDISKECLIGKLLLSVHSQKDGARSPTYTLSDSAQFDDDTIHEWPDDGRKSSLPQGQSWLKPTPTARKPNTIKPNTVKPRTSDGRPLHPAIHTTSTDIAHRVPFCIDSITSEIGRRVIPKA
nr:hypothetical protein BaRGS_007141 [Batillaria attramentaria]